MFSWSLFWVGCVCLGAVGASAKSVSANNIFQTLLLLLSLLLIVYGLKVDLLPLVIMLGFALFSLTLVRLRIPIFWALVPMLLIWAVAKWIGYVLMPNLPLVSFVGISYFVVKLFTFLRDYQVGLIKAPRIITTLNYLFFAPTFLAGPMHYYREFDKTIRAPNLPSAQSIIPLVFRILWGATKVFVLSPFLAPNGFPIPADTVIGGLDLVIRSFVFTFQLYFDFSGYSDLAIGSAKLMGIETPENFNRPLLSRNVVEFWQRWHVTLMRVITSYVYVPLTRNLTARKSVSTTLIMISGVVVAFTVSGFWHGASVGFILWGLYNAVAIILYELTRPSLSNLFRKEMFAGRMMAQVVRVASIGLTFCVISFGWILFNMDSSAVQRSLGL